MQGKAAAEKSNEAEEKEYKIQTYQARTWGDLLPILSKPSVQAGKGLCMIEVFMDREDAPDTLKKLVRNVQRRNSGESERGDRKEDGIVEEEKGVGDAEGKEEEETMRIKTKMVEEKVVKAAG